MPYKLSDLIDIPSLQNLIDSLFDATQMPTAILDNEGNVLTNTGWVDACANFHRMNPITKKMCIESDTTIAERIKSGEKYAIYRCPMGLVDSAIPIIIRGEHLGNVFTGQLFHDEPDLEKYRAHSATYGFDEESYLEAVRKVPTFTEEQVKRNLGFLSELANYIVQLGLKEIERKQAQAMLQITQYSVDKATFEVFWITEDAHFIYVNDRACEALGYSQEDLLELTVPDVDPNFDMDKWQTHWAELKQTGNLKIETTHRRKDGSIFPVEMVLNYQEYDGIEYNFAYANDITERKQAEEALFESEKKFKSLFTNMDNGFALHEMVFDEKGKPIDYIFLDLNEAFEKQTSLQRKDLIGRKVTEVLPGIENDPSDWIGTYGAVVLTGKSITFENYSETLDRWYSVVAYKPGEGQFAVVFTDITERKQAEQIQQVLLDISQAAAVTDNLETLLDLVRERLGQIIDTTNFYIALYDESSGGFTFPCYYDQFDDLDGTVQFLSGGPTDAVRITKKSVIWDKDKIKKMRAGKDLKLYGADAECWLGAPLQTKEGVIGVLAVQSYDNPKAYSEKHRQIMDNIVGTIAIAIEKKRTEEALAKSEQDLRNLYDNAMEGIFRITPDGKFLFANPTMAKMLGYNSVDDLRDTEVANLYTRIDQYEEFKKVYKEYGHIKNWETELLRKDGSKIWVRGSMTGVSDDKGDTKYYEGFISDISESKKLEQEMLRSQKLESVGHLAGGLAHDFNNALAKIQLQAATAAITKNLPEEVVESLKEINESVDQAMGITQQMLTFSKGGVPVKQPTDIGLLLVESVQFALHGININPNIELDENLSNADVDANQIKQIISNLVINARHAMPGGGELLVLAKNVLCSQKSPIGPLRPGEYVSISVVDQGIGINPDILNKIFDPYFTTKQDGSGLGLFSCYIIIDRHGGWITAESEIGVGSTITFYLPTTKDALPESEKSLDMEESKDNTGNILIMDDEANIRKFMSILLNNLGYTTTTACDGDEATQLYKDALKSSSPFDLVILDLTIPKGLGGKETIKRLKEIDADVTAIVSSGYSNDAVISNYKKYGFSAVLPKPYKVRMLADVVKDTIKGNYILDSLDIYA